LTAPELRERDSLISCSA